MANVNLFRNTSIFFSLAKPIAIIFFINLVIYSQIALASSLSNEEKIAFIRGSVPACVSKNIIAQNITTSDDKKLIENYCTCHASTMASIVTREEMVAVNKGSVPKTFESKVLQARQQCIQQIKK